MKTRVVSGFVMLLLAVLITFLNSYLLNFFIFGVVLYFAFLESLVFYGLKSQTKLVWIALAFYTLALYTNPIYSSLLAVVTVVSILAFKKDENMNIVFPFLYPAMPIFLLWEVCSEYGINYLGWMILSIAASDSGAYFIGKKFGKRKFSLSSPNKTLEGVIGGLLVGTIFGSIFGSFVINSVLQAIMISFFVCFGGVFGDLFESYLKRRVDVKDSGNLIPGHGGVLDRIDGYMFGVVIFVWTLSW